MIPTTLAELSPTHRSLGLVELVLILIPNPSTVSSLIELQLTSNSLTERTISIPLYLITSPMDTAARNAASLSRALKG